MNLDSSEWTWTGRPDQLRLDQYSLEAEWGTLDRRQSLVPKDIPLNQTLSFEGFCHVRVHFL